MKGGIKTKAESMCEAKITKLMIPINEDQWMRGMFCLCEHLTIILNMIMFIITMLLLSLKKWRRQVMRNENGQRCACENSARGSCGIRAEELIIKSLDH